MALASALLKSQKTGYKKDSHIQGEQGAVKAESQHFNLTYCFISSPFAGEQSQNNKGMCHCLNTYELHCTKL